MPRFSAHVRRAVSLAIAMAIAAARDVAAQQSEPKPVAGRSVTIWQVQTKQGIEPLRQDVRVAFARNDTTAPIAITRVHVSKCVNVRLACDTVVPASQVLAPGQTWSVVRVFPTIPGKTFSFVLDVEWRTATECIEPRPPSSELHAGRTSAPNTAQMILPPTDGIPGSSRGKPVDVQFFVGANGRVDSVGVTGISDKSFLARFRGIMMRYVFDPAQDRGCPVPGTTSIQITMGS